MFETEINDIQTAHKPTVAVGIPFMASCHTKALELCLRSICRFLPQVKEVFLQLDVTNRELAETFNPSSVLHIMPKIRVRRYTRTRSGDYKHALAEWLVSQTTAEYAIVMHSDVFFWDSRIHNLLIAPLVRDPNQVFCAWKTPLVEHVSTFHLSAASARRFWVAPRIASWLFSFRVSAFCDALQRDPALLKGHYWIRSGVLGEIDEDRAIFLNWLSSQGIDVKQFKTEDCLIDIGTFLRIRWDRGELSGVCLGEQGNPDFSTMEFIYHPEGFVHIEQYDPERFNGSLYGRDTMTLRTERINQILKNEYYT